MGPQRRNSSIPLELGQTKPEADSEHLQCIKSKATGHSKKSIMPIKCYIRKHSLYAENKGKEEMRGGGKTGVRKNLAQPR